MCNCNGEEMYVTSSSLNPLVDQWTAMDFGGSDEIAKMFGIAEDGGTGRTRKRTTASTAPPSPFS